MMSEQLNGPQATFVDRERGGGWAIPFRDVKPRFEADCFVAPGASVIGSARLGKACSIWFHCVIRADIAPITIGESVNIQDNSVVHVGDKFPCVIGDRCVVGHRAILHGCDIEDETLVGMGAIILNGAKIGAGSVIAAGALVPEGKIIPPRSLVMGAPGKIRRDVSDEELATTRHLAKKYAGVASEYLNIFRGGIVS